MPKQCKRSGCIYNRFGGGYCKIHQWCRTDGKAPKAIKPFSKKRQEENKLYFPESRQFVIDNKFCKINSPVCTGKTQAPHHPKGRGKNLRNWKIMIPACNACNGYVEDNDAWAIKNGFKQKKHVKQ